MNPEMNVIVSPAPAGVTDTGVGGYVVTNGGTSGTVYDFPADVPATLPNSGWTVQVRDYFNPNTILATITLFQEISFTKSLNDTGFGELIISRADPFLAMTLTPVAGDEGEGSSILMFPLYFSFVQDGAERFRMVYDGKARDRSRSDAAEQVVLSGTGRAIELSWGTVLPANWFPEADVKAFPRRRDSVFWAQFYIVLFDEAKARGEIPDTLTLGFTATHDSYGQPWGLQLGESDREVEIGSNLFEILQTWADAEEFDWIVTPAGVVRAAPVLGQDLSGTIRFYNGVTNQEVTAIEDRKDLRNRIYVEGTDGHISLVEGEYSMARWGTRAMYLRSDEARSERQRTRLGRGTLRQTRRPNREREVKVPPDPTDPITGASYGHSVFIDYGIGDLIGFGSGYDDSGLPLDSRNVRVQEIAIRVNGEGYDLELMMETRIERFAERVRRLLASGIRLGAWSSAKTARTGKAPVGNLRDTDTDLKVNGDSLVYDHDSELWKAGKPGIPLVWGYPGPLSLIDDDTAMILPVDGLRRLVRVTARVNHASTSGPIVLRLKRNGTAVHTLTIPQGDHRTRELVDIAVTEADDLSLLVIETGAGAAYLQYVVETGV